MKKSTFTALLVTAVLLTGARVKSQSPQEASPAPQATPATQQTARLPLPLERLQALKTANQALLEKQEKSLGTLDEMLSEAQQIRIFSKRS